MGKVLMKGNEAIAEAAVQAGCDAYFGYPITPQNEVPAYMSRRMPEEGRVFLQSESELAAINMVFGASATGKRVMTSSSSPGISLMQEAISYIAGAQLPCVLLNIMRGGPGLGGILPAQSDYFQATKGGGHGDYRLLGQTIDDAAGEAFDKVARFLDLGYPGGPAIDAAALNGDPDAIRFPRALSDDPDNLDVSFSGLKTAVMNHVRKHPDVASADVAASFQMAVVDVLVTKARRAAETIGAKGIVLGGGVAANSLLREELLGACARDGVRGFLPSRSMCTDNAAMIAACGYYRLQAGKTNGLDLDVTPGLKLS